MCDMAYSTDVESSLSTDDLRREGMQRINVVIRLVLEVLVMRVELLDLLLSKSLDIFHSRVF